MGRYYTGDIKGKFWFGIQSSDDADFFGVIGERPNSLVYYFEEEDIKKVQIGIEICKKELGKYKLKIDKFFKDADCYSDEDLSEALKINKDKMSELLVWYARLELGMKIYKCLKKHKVCMFDAEC